MQRKCKRDKISAKVERFHKLGDVPVHVCKRIHEYLYSAVLVNLCKVTRDIACVVEGQACFPRVDGKLHGTGPKNLAKTFGRYFVTNRKVSIISPWSSVACCLPRVGPVHEHEEGMSMNRYLFGSNYRDKKTKLWHVQRMTCTRMTATRCMCGASFVSGLIQLGYISSRQLDDLNKDLSLSNLGKWPVLWTRRRIVGDTVVILSDISKEDTTG